MYENETFGARAKAFFSRWGRLLLRSKTGMLGLILVLAFTLIAIFAPQLAGHDPTALNPGNMTTPPFWMKGGSMEFPLGTDNLGRCILCRIMYGTRVSMLISAVSGGIPTLVFVIGFTGWIQYARLIRSEVLSLKNREFVKAAITIGTPNSTIIRRHIIPNVMSSFIVVSTLAVASSIIAETSLSFLGLGIQSPQISWGGMLSDGRNYLATHWWIATFPGIAITLAVLGIMFLGNWIRDVLDPHNQGLQ